MNNEVTNENNEVVVNETPAVNEASVVNQTVQPANGVVYTNVVIPNEYKPLSAFGYVGYNILFSIPLIGLILLIVFSLDNSNLVRRNYARSFFIVYALVIIIFILIFVIIGVGAASVGTTGGIGESIGGISDATNAVSSY